MSTEVWINQEGTITIQEMDVSGNVSPTVLVTDDFVQGVDIAPRRHEIQFRQPGVVHEEERSQIIGWDLSFRSWYYSKAIQHTQFCDSTKEYRILFKFYNRYTGQDEELDFRRARTSKGPDIKGSDNEVYELDTSWFAEAKV